MIYFLIFFGLGPKLETNQVSQPLARPYPPNFAWKDKEWTKVGSKWKCKVGTYIVAYCDKWLLTKLLRRRMVWWQKNAKLGKPLTFAQGLRHQDHIKMNAHILGNAQAEQRRNDQKVVSCTRAKAK